MASVRVRLYYVPLSARVIDNRQPDKKKYQRLQWGYEALRIHLTINPHTQDLELEHVVAPTTDFGGLPQILPCYPDSSSSYDENQLAEETE